MGTQKEHKRRTSVMLAPSLIAAGTEEAGLRGGTFSGLLGVALARELERSRQDRELAAEARRLAALRDAS